MQTNTVTELVFSEPYLKAEMVENVSDYRLESRSVVVNIGKETLSVHGNITLEQSHSSIFENVTLTRAERILILTPSTQMVGCQRYPHAKEIMETWDTAKALFGDGFSCIPLWRSKQHEVENLKINLWYAPSNTNCAIHNQHDFKERHTQIIGIGRMQKFHDNPFQTSCQNLILNPDYCSSLYQDVIMAPGYTHNAFYYGDSCTYPWHQYYSDTDCIWMVVETYGECGA